MTLERVYLFRTWQLDYNCGSSSNLMKMSIEQTNGPRQMSRPIGFKGNLHSNNCVIIRPVQELLVLMAV